jgi:hypothetical protein
MTGSSWWMFAEMSGQDRMKQFVRTRLLHLKTILWYRPVYGFLKRWTSRPW